MRVASADAGPLTARGKISPTMSQLMGPKLTCTPHKEQDSSSNQYDKDLIVTAKRYSQRVGYENFLHEATGTLQDCCLLDLLS